MDRALALGDWDGFAQRRRAAAQPRQAPRHRRRQLHRVHHRRAARMDQSDRAAGRPRRRGDRHAVERARPPDQLRATRHRLARRAVRLRPSDPGRHRYRPDRRRLPFRPLDAARRHRHRQGVGRGHRQGQAHRRPRARSGRARHRVRRRPFHRARAPTVRIGIFEVAREALHAQRPARRPARGRWRPNATRPSQVGGFPYGSHVCEVEIDLELRDDRDRRLRRGRRRRPRDQSAHLAWPVPRRDRAGRSARRCSRAASTTGTAGSCCRARSWTTPSRGRTICLSFATEISEVPSPNNPLGVRAGGEGGTTPALAVVVNAIVDALAGLRRRPHGNAGHPRAGLARDNGETAPGPTCSAPAGVGDRSRLLS